MSTARALFFMVGFLTCLNDVTISCSLPSFALGIQGFGSVTRKGSSLMIASIVGGALIPLAQEGLQTALDCNWRFSCLQSAMCTSPRWDSHLGLVLQDRT